LRSGTFLTRVGGRGSCGYSGFAPGRALHEAVFMRFTEGLDTADLKAAGRLLATLR